MTYEELLKCADNEGLITKEKPLYGNDGRIYDNRIAIRQSIDTSIEKVCVLAEELGHYHTTAGDILDQSDIGNQKQELRARRWAYGLLIRPTDIITAYRFGCRNRYETAEFLGVTEEFLQEALDSFRRQYGIYLKHGNYIVTFEPCLGVWEKK